MVSPMVSPRDMSPMVSPMVSPRVELKQAMSELEVNYVLSIKKTKECYEDSWQTFIDDCRLLQTSTKLLSPPLLGFRECPPARPPARMHARPHACTHARTHGRA